MTVAVFMVGDVEYIGHAKVRRETRITENGVIFSLLFDCWITRAGEMTHWVGSFKNIIEAWAAVEKELGIEG